MSSDLDLLIDYYQWEIIRLKETIRENLELHFYREVEFDERALGHSQRELDRLLELKNSHYPQIKRAKSKIAMYERLGKREKSQFERQFYVEYTKPKIDELKEVLKNLKKLPEKSSNQETQAVDEAIFKLIQRENKSFVLYLNQEHNTVLRISIDKHLENVFVFNSLSIRIWSYRGVTSCLLGYTHICRNLTS